ncbi:MAG TPA: rRNA maturation RNase YbeY [Erysipelotrichaceae bacterium]|nr:rRNA maturation RNase YbeY [Erysipelotrichia bacterium]HPX33038.1 rRNA maturation RNase YbeY [Erysipelotrichaceae bacterium]HQA85740.1 rRNA maturation RNase YbeY [Erysipelotrichaceae bacterium]
MELNVINRTKRKGYVKYRTDFKKIILKAIEVLDLNEHICLSVVFILDKKMQQINKEYRNIDKTTDVISFALNDDKNENVFFEKELGDIFINIDAAVRQAKEYNHSERREICFLFTHGLLHLCGFDHQNKKDEEEMIKYQKLILDDIISRNN